MPTPCSEKAGHAISLGICCRTKDGLHVGPGGGFSARRIGVLQGLAHGPAPHAHFNREGIWVRVQVARKERWTAPSFFARPPACCFLPSYTPSAPGSETPFPSPHAPATRICPLLHHLHIVFELGPHISPCSSARCCRSPRQPLHASIRTRPLVRPLTRRVSTVVRMWSHSQTTKSI